MSSPVERTTSASERRRTKEITVDLGDASVTDDGGGVRGGFAATGSYRRLHCEEQARHVDVVVLDGSAGEGCVVVASGMRRAGVALREARKPIHTTYPAELHLATGKQHSNHPRRARAARGPRRLHSCYKETEARKRSIRKTIRPVRNTVGSRKGHAYDALSARITRPKTRNNR